jgi:TetR/AcrR family transcriptional regulator
LAEVPADHLIYSIWATTQHYADFEAQIEVLSGTPEKIVASAEAYLINMYTKLLKP